jgi:hypothetical protein
MDLNIKYLIKNPQIIKIYIKNKYLKIYINHIH